MPRTSANKKMYLEKHGAKWRVSVDVPRELRDKLGTKLKRSLYTDSLTVANQRKWPVVAEFKELIGRERSGGAAYASLQQEALGLASDIRHSESENHREFLSLVIADRAREIAGPPVRDTFDPDQDHMVPQYAPERERKALQFAKMARGQAVPIDLHHSRYLEQLAVKPRTRSDDERAMKFLLEWCRREDIPPHLDTFTERSAVRFMDDIATIAASSHPVTLNKCVFR
ncbi:DUF6538 domain-containing protein [Aurantimonas sp. A2-1-M11]|uniref:DUF6538 domain-containing protein n=1 Tax=Aurantimonas sp. A2-1-M11 TaxID=3113712 RepID=UPI002F958849